MMRRGVVLIATLALTGCYVSKQPLITPATADYPVPDGAHFAAFVPAGAKWLAHGGRTLRRSGAYYVYVDDRGGKPSLPFLLKRIRPGLFVAQLSDNADPAQAREHAYELIDFDGKTAIQYSGTCPARAEWVTRHLVEHIEQTTTPRCVFGNLGNLVTVLREAATNAAPEAKYILGPNPR